jgi:TonB family protein
MNPFGKLVIALFFCWSCSVGRATADPISNSGTHKGAVPGGVAKTFSGPLAKERASLWTSIQELSIKGLSTKLYDTAFEQIENSIKQGASDRSVKTDIDRLKRAVMNQLHTMATNNTSVVGDDTSRHAYMIDLRRRIKRHWSPFGFPSNPPVVSFKVRRDGTLSGLQIDRSSGNAGIDNAALKAVQDAAPFRPTPLDMKDPAPIQYSFSSK